MKTKTLNAKIPTIASELTNGIQVLKVLATGAFIDLMARTQSIRVNIKKINQKLSV